MEFFKGAGINFKRSMLVSNANNLLQISWNKCRNRTSLLILVCMAKLMGQKPDSALAMTNINPVTKGHANHIGSKETRCEGGLLQSWVFWQRKMGNLCNAN